MKKKKDEKQKEDREHLQTSLTLNPMALIRVHHRLASHLSVLQNVARGILKCSEAKLLPVLTNSFVSINHIVEL